MAEDQQQSKGQLTTPCQPPVDGHVDGNVYGDTASAATSGGNEQHSSRRGLFQHGLENIHAQLTLPTSCL